jgi:hypothetical protein
MGSTDPGKRARLTDRHPRNILNLMRCLAFLALVSSTFAASLRAQRIPGRDLLEFPIGTLGDAPALASHVGDGFGNPALILVPAGDRGRVAVATLDAGRDQGVSAQSLAVAAALPSSTSLALSLVRVSVADLVRTETDPQSIGNDIPYNTTVVSVVAARRTEGHLVTGLAARYRSGELDGIHGAALGLDAGVLGDGLLGVDGRLAISSFLWRPGADASDRATLNVAGDARVTGTDERHEGRIGYSFSYTSLRTREHYVYGTARSGDWEGNLGLARSITFDAGTTRVRFGIDFHYKRYLVGIAREDTGAGLAPTYQFALTAAVP